MKKKKSFGIILIVVGLVLFGIAHYIKQQVEAGTLQVMSAQRGLNAGKSLFSLTPATQDIGDGLTSPIQRKIDAGKGEIAYYTNLANGLQVLGIVCVAAGAYVVLRGRKK